MKIIVKLLFKFFISFFIYSSLQGQIIVNYTNSLTNLTEETGGAPSACGANRFNLKHFPIVDNGCIVMIPADGNDNTGPAFIFDPIEVDRSLLLKNSLTFSLKLHYYETH